MKIIAYGLVTSCNIWSFLPEEHWNLLSYLTLQLFKMEDVSMGMWVEQFNSTKHVQYSHNWKYCQYGCMENYHTAHYQSPRQMVCLWDNLMKGHPHCCNVWRKLQNLSLRTYLVIVLLCTPWFCRWRVALCLTMSHFYTRPKPVEVVSHHSIWLLNVFKVYPDFHRCSNELSCPSCIGWCNVMKEHFPAMSKFCGTLILKTCVWSRCVVLP